MPASNMHARKHPVSTAHLPGWVSWLKAISVRAAIFSLLFVSLMLTAHTASAAIDTTNLVANIYGPTSTLPMCAVTGGTPTDDTWQTYTCTFSASSSNTAITFLLRNDPSYFFLDNISVKLQGNATELLTNGGFEGGLSSGSYNTAPNQPVSWNLLGTQGLTAAGNVMDSTSVAITYLAGNGSYTWGDGAVGGFDGIQQIIPTTPGQTYTISFDLYSATQLGTPGTGWNNTPATSTDPYSDNITQILVYAGNPPAGFIAAPSTTTDAASGITATGATLNGTVIDNGATTSVTFDYGTTTGYGTNVVATTGGTVSAGAGATAAAKTLNSLTCNTTYHFRVKAVNSQGTNFGSDATFTTSACAASTVSTLSSLSQSSGTLSPSFASGTASYTASVANAVSSITVTPTVSDSTATVKVNGTAVASGTPSGSIPLSVGSNTITVVGTAQDGTTTSTYTVTVTRAAASQTITFNNPGAQNFGTTPTLTASASSSLTPTFTSSTTGVCTITSGGTLTFVTAGGCTINADQAGNSSYLAAPQVSQSFTVNAVIAGAPTIGTATAGNAQASVTFTPPASSGGATITGYTVTSSPSGFTGTGSSSPITVTGLTNGTAYTFTVTATNSAGTGSASAASNSVTPKASQTITFGTAPTVVVGGTGTASANATSGLAVTFSSTTTSVCTVSGSTVTGVTAGTCAIAANQAGDSNYNAASQVTQGFTIGKANQTITFGTAPSVVVGGTGTASATGGASTSSVLFSSTTTSVCTVSGSTVSGVTAGTCTIAANQAGDSNYNAASQVTQGFTIGKANQTITFGTAPSVVVGGTGTVSANATSGLTVTFSSTTTSVCTLSGSTVTGVTAGTCTIAANQAGDSNYNAASQVTQNITIGKASQSIGTISLSSTTLIPGETATASATATSGLSVSFGSTTPSVCTVSGSTVTAVAAGTCTIAANQPGNANYNAAAQVTRDIAVAIPLAMTVSALSDGAVTTETTQNVSGMVTNPSNLRSLTINDAVVQVNPDGSFSYPVQLVAGVNTVTIVAINNAGGTITDTRTITLDTTAPHQTITYPPDNKVVIQNHVTVTGTISDLSTGIMTVSFTVNGSAPQTASLIGTTYSFTANLDQGMNTILVSAVDGVGKTAQAKRTVSYMPSFSLAITDPASDIRTVQNSYLLTGTVADSTTPVTVTVSMDGQAFTPTVVNGTFRQQLSLSEAKVYQVSVTGTDQNSNSLSVQRNIIHTVPKASFTIVDALLSLKMAVGLITPQPDQVLRLDVAPMVNGVSVGDGKIDIEDTIIVLRLAVGLL